MHIDDLQANPTLLADAREPVPCKGPWAHANGRESLHQRTGE